MGGYVLKEASGDPQVVLVGTGSELQVAVKAAENTGGRRHCGPRGVDAVRGNGSTPKATTTSSRCCPPTMPKVVVEAGVPVGWKDLLGANTEAVGIDHFGASADDCAAVREVRRHRRGGGREGQGADRLSVFVGWLSLSKP